MNKEQMLEELQQIIYKGQYPDPTDPKIQPLAERALWEQSQVKAQAQAILDAGYLKEEVAVEPSATEDWTGEIGRRVGMWLPLGMVRSYKAEGEIVRFTPTQFIVKVDNEEGREVRFLRKHEWLGESYRDQVGHLSKGNAARCYPNPLPKD